MMDNNTGITTLWDDDKDLDWQFIVWAMDLANTDRGQRPSWEFYIKWLCDGSYIDVKPDGSYDIIDNITRFPENEYDVYPQPIVSMDGTRRNYHHYNRNTERGCK